MVLGRVVTLLKAVGLVVDRGRWLEPGRVLGCAYPRKPAGLDALADQGVTLLVNLHERPDRPERLAAHGLTELHLPVVDFTAPSQEQLAQGVAAIDEAVAEGRAVAVHCGGGLGRTGTLLACYLVHQGLGPEEAIRRVRAVRPGSIETGGQVEAVTAFHRRQRR